VINNGWDFVVRTDLEELLIKLLVLQDVDGMYLVGQASLLITQSVLVPTIRKAAASWPAI